MEEALGFTKLLLIQIDLYVMCFFSLYSPVSLSSCPFFGHPELPPPRGGSASGVPLESALNLVSRMSPCGAYDTHLLCISEAQRCSSRVPGLYLLQRCCNDCRGCCSAVAVVRGRQISLRRARAHSLCIALGMYCT